MNKKINDVNNDNKNKNEVKEKNLAYGGQALIEGVMMRAPSNYAFTVQKPDGEFYKEKTDYVSLGKRVKVLGLPFIRGISGFFESMIIGMKILNKSADIAFPEENSSSNSTLSTVLTFVTAFLFGMLIFVGLPYYLTQFLSLDDYSNPLGYNLVAGVIRLVFFFIYLSLISFFKEARRLFGYHGAEHKSISTYENGAELTTENVKKYSRLHPRCGTSFIFIVFIITVIIFPFFNLYFNSQDWYLNLQPIPAKVSTYEYENNFFKKIKSNDDITFVQSIYTKESTGNFYIFNNNLEKSDDMRARGIFKKAKHNQLGSLLQKIVIILSHILVGMPIVSSISYELLKLSGKLSKNPIVKLFILPGLLVQLFTTREPDDGMIKTAILSLKMVIGTESPDTPRRISDPIESNSSTRINPAVAMLLLPLYMINSI